MKGFEEQHSPWEVIPPENQRFIDLVRLLAKVPEESKSISGTFIASYRLSDLMRLMVFVSPTGGDHHVETAVIIKRKSLDAPDMHGTKYSFESESGKVEESVEIQNEGENLQILKGIISPDPKVREVSERKMNAAMLASDLTKREMSEAEVKAVNEGLEMFKGIKPINSKNIPLKG